MHANLIMALSHVADAEVDRDVAAVRVEVERLARRGFAPCLELREAELAQLRKPQLQLGARGQQIDVGVRARDRSGEQRVLCVPAHDPRRGLELRERAQESELSPFR